MQQQKTHSSKFIQISVAEERVPSACLLPVGIGILHAPPALSASSGTPTVSETRLDVPEVLLGRPEIYDKKLWNILP